MAETCDARRVRNGARCRAPGCNEPVYSAVMFGAATGFHLCLVHTADLYEALGDTLVDTDPPGF